MLLSRCVILLGVLSCDSHMTVTPVFLQTNDLSAVHAGVKFSCKFTLKEIESRWQALLYDKHISKLVGVLSAAVPTS